MQSGIERVFLNGAEVGDDADVAGRHDLDRGEIQDQEQDRRRADAEQNRCLGPTTVSGRYTPDHLK